MISRHPDFMAKLLPQLCAIIEQTLGDLRQESVGLQLGSAVFEKLPVNENFLRSVLVKAIEAMNYYRENTKSKIIPSAIVKSVFVFFATFIIAHGCQALIQATNSI